MAIVIFISIATTVTVARPVMMATWGASEVIASLETTKGFDIC